MMKNASVSKMRLVFNILIQIILIPCAVMAIFPFLWMIATSLKTTAESFSVPPTLFPEILRFENYIESMTTLPFGKAYFNSFKITIINVVGQVFTAAMAGYSLSKLRFRGYMKVFYAFVAVMMVPATVVSIPQFMMFSSIGLIDTHMAIILMTVAYMPFGVFLCRQFVMAVPDETIEAAVIDGASYGSIFFSVVLPLIKPALASLTIFSFMWNWNSYYTPLIYLSSIEKFTVPLLLTMFRGRYTTEWNLIMASATIAVLPVILVYLVGQKYIIEGIALTGSKN